MDETPNLTLPYIMAAQAQKHVSHNEAIRALDAIVQLSVLDRDLTAPPGSPADGDRHIVGALATAEWSSKDGQIAAFQDNIWMFYQPAEGWLCWVAAENRLLAFDGAAWSDVTSGGGSTNPTPLVGVNTTASAPDKLAVKSDAVLFSHDDVTPGTGDIQTKLNKATAGNTATFLFQDDWSGRAEIGLAGDDDFHFKVSPNGSSWKEAMVIDETSGHTHFPFTPTDNNLLVNGDFQINQRSFAGGALVASTFGHDRWQADSGGANYALSGFTITLNSGAILQKIEPSLWGYDDLASTQLTISVDNPSADISISVGSVNGTITAGTGRRHITLTTASGDTGNLSVKLATASAVSFAKIKVEIGSKASAWMARSRTQETTLCRWYYTEVGGESAYQFFSLGYVNSATLAYVLFKLPSMRSTPSMGLSSPTHFAIGSGPSFLQCTNIFTAAAGSDLFMLGCNVTGGLTIGFSAGLQGFNNASARLKFTAEI